MKKLTLLFFIFSFATLSAQKNKGNNFHWVSEQLTFGIMGGQYHPDMTAFNDSITRWGGKQLFNEGLRGYGISIGVPVNVNRKGEFDGALAFSVMQKTKVSIGKNDSLYYQVRGWNLMTSIYGKDVIPGSTVALVLAPGVDWGVNKMIRSLNGDGGLYKNPFIAPLVRAELRFVFGPVMLGARGCYRYDISHAEWKQKSGPAYELPELKNTGKSIEFFVGWGNAHFQ